MSVTDSFVVITGRTVQELLGDNCADIVRVVERAYAAHGAGLTVNPHSHFLRFPDRPDNRIIALPASLGADFQVDGIKWISSVPGNHGRGLPRASAVLILNDPETGFPLACLESSIISATRTAASAVLAADRLSPASGRARTVSFIGTGLIARHIHRFLVGTGWSFDEIGVYDTSPAAATAFGTEIAPASGAAHITTHPDLETAVRESDLVIFATTAPAPYVSDPDWFAHNPVVLNISLRDLGPAVILAAANILDDVEHCVRQGTSPHLAEQASGSRDFVTGVLSDVLAGLPVPTDRPVIFSPFGLGVLDLAVADLIHRVARSTGRVVAVPDFFPAP